MKEDKEFGAKIKRAQDVVESVPGLPPGFRDISFKVVLEHLLEEGSLPATQESASSERPRAGTTLIGVIERAKIKTHSEKVLAAAYILYLNGQTEFKQKDIVEQYKKALLQHSKNFAEEIRRNIAKGFLMAMDKKGGTSTYSITHEGIEHLEKKLGGSNEQD